MNQTLVNIFKLMEQIGLVDVLLPFILVFVIVFGVLERTKVLGVGNRNANVIASMVIGLMIVAAVNYVNIINDIARLFGLLVVMAVAFALIYGMFGKDLKFIKKKKEGAGSGGSGSGSQKSSGKKSDSGKSGKYEDLGEFNPSKPPFNE